jgi:hypothetical protein
MGWVLRTPASLTRPANSKNLMILSSSVEPAKQKRLLEHVSSSNWPE